MSTYGRKIIRNEFEYELIKTRIVASWAVCLILGGVIGGWIGSMERKETVKYGIAESTITEVDFNWNSGRMDFKPLNVPMNEDMQEFIYCLSEAYEIDFAFVMAVIKNESGFRTDAVSTTNDFGLMQINTINHEWLSKELGITDFNDPVQNVRAGMFILRRLFEKYEDPTKVLMCYNLGETGAAKLWQQGVYQTSYSQKISKTYAEYSKELRGE